MTEKQIQNTLTAIGISSGMLLIIVMVYAAFVFYKNYLETQKLKLQIAFLHKTIDTPGQVAQANPMEGNYAGNTTGKYRGITELREYNQSLPTKNPYERIKM